MANSEDVQIPTPMVSGATDNPDAPQSGTAQAPPLPAGFTSAPPVAAPPPLPAGFSSTPPSTPNPAAPHVGPTGQPSPNNVYAAAPEENTSEDAAAALARRQAAHPILSGIGQGTESLLQPVFHPIDTVENLAKQSFPAFHLYDSVKHAYPLIQAYENSRSQGKTVWESIAAANDQAKKQDAAHQALEQAMAEYKKNPTQTTANVVTQVAGNVALLLAGGAGATETEAPALAAEAEVPVAGVPAAEATTVPKPGIVNTVKNVVNQIRQAITPSETGLVSQVLKGRKVAQPGAQAAVREATQSGVETANTAAAAREATQSAVKVPPEYQDLIDEAMKQEPAWTPEKAQPVIKSLGDNFEVKGSVGEGKVTNNDLDIWQKTGKLSEASDKLTDLGFKKAYDTEHGEVWTNEKTGQNVDLWDAQHEPKAGFGPDQTPEPEPELPIANKKSAVVPPNAPLIKGNTTILDDHLDTLAANEKTAYQRMDDTAGFDIKAERQQLANDKYKLSQLGNTDVDITQRGKLIESINDSEDRIAQANEKMKAAGVDPDEADALHKQRMAGQDFKKVLTRYTNADGSVNVRGLLRGSKQLRFAKFGDRLEQFFGSSEAADKFVNQLDVMDKLGARAVKARWIAGLVGGYVLPKIVGHTIGGQVGNVINALP